MEFFPAIDLQNGQCVRLAQGDFNAATVYEADPLRQALRFAEAGARWVHVVDLDGARDEKSKQGSIVAAIAKSAPLKVQVGGGLRDIETAERLLGMGATRVVIGSLAVTNPMLTRTMMERLGGERVVLALDVRLNEAGEPEVLTKGWQAGSQRLLWDIVDAYLSSGLKTVLCTDVSRDGMMTGPNLDLYRAFVSRWSGLDLLASGGVRDLSDVFALREVGVAGVIAGKAIYEGRLDVAEAVKALGGGDAG